MKVAIILLALVAGSFSTPQPRKTLHEHVHDFIDVINEVVGPKLENHHLDYKEILAALSYMRKTNIKDLYYEMDSLPEYKSVINFLEKYNIDVLFVIDWLNNMADKSGATDVGNKQVRHELRDTDFGSLIKDCIESFPMDELIALYHQKMDENLEFREAMEIFTSGELKDRFNDVWDNESIQTKIKELLNEIRTKLEGIIEHIMAILEQNNY